MHLHRAVRQNADIFRPAANLEGEAQRRGDAGIEASSPMHNSKPRRPPLLREQAFGAAYGTNRLETPARYEVHLDRKLERTLAMLKDGGWSWRRCAECTLRKIRRKTNTKATTASPKTINERPSINSAEIMKGYQSA